MVCNAFLNILLLFLRTIRGKTLRSCYTRFAEMISTPNSTSPSTIATPSDLNGLRESFILWSGLGHAGNIYGTGLLPRCLNFLSQIFTWGKSDLYHVAICITRYTNRCVCRAEMLDWQTGIQWSTDRWCDLGKIIFSLSLCPSVPVCKTKIIILTCFPGMWLGLQSVWISFRSSDERCSV